MAAKLIALTVTGMAIALALLAMRAERVRLAKDIAEFDQQARQVRVDLWQSQAEVASLATPQALAERIARAHLTFEPAVPQPPVANRAELARSAGTHDRTASP